MVLIVDDHEETRRLLVRMLALEGYSAAAVSGAAEALAFVQAQMPSLVVLDYNMPEMDGLTFFQRIRQDSRLAALPVIMFSASTGELRRRALAAGVAAFVQKGSMDWTQLFREVARFAGPDNPAASAR